MELQKQVGVLAAIETNSKVNENIDRVDRLVLGLSTALIGFIAYSQESIAINNFRDVLLLISLTLLAGSAYRGLVIINRNGDFWDKNHRALMCTLQMLDLDQMTKEEESDSKKKEYSEVIDKHQNAFDEYEKEGMIIFTKNVDDRKLRNTLLMLGMIVYLAGKITIQ